MTTFPKRRIVKAGFYLACGIFGLYGFIWFTFWALSLRNWGAEFVSPTTPTHEVLFIEDGRLKMYAKSNNERPRLVASLSVGERQFAYGQWTYDGLGFVCTLEGGAYGRVQVAYDFSGKKSFVPWWVNYMAEVTNKADVESFEVNLRSLITTHGGLRNERIDAAAVKQNLVHRFWHEQSQSVGQ